MSDPYIYAWLIPLFPLVGFLLNGLFGGTLKKVSGVIATVMVFLSFGVSCYLFSVLTGNNETVRQHTVYLAPWLVVPGQDGLKINFELLIDPLSVLMMLIITGVGGLIHLYSINYMAADKGFSRFFTYLNLFVFFMLLLVMSNNFMLLFVGWEGVGLCSYLLIGFFYEKKSAGDAAKKAFIMNRIGDVGVLIGMFMIIHYFGTLDFVTGHAGVLGITNAAHAHQISAVMGGTVVTVMLLMLFLGATGKSAQIPLYTWLPDAMEGPTPVSALIHAATMVTAGVYMVSRAHALFELSDTAMLTIMVIGIATAIFAASIGLAQNDIKRVLAYSTVSQLGYMFAACGAGIFAAGMFHVMTHAFFKACLFLGSGSVIHAIEHAMHANHDSAHAEHSDPHDVDGPDPNDPQDMRNMGGLKNKTPITALTMGVATLAIAGLCPFAGYYSKEEILSSVYGTNHGGIIAWGILAATALITTFYMIRLFMKTFWGAPRTDAAKNAHESSPIIWIPLVILAALSLVAGWPILPLSFKKFEEFLAPSIATQGYESPLVRSNPILGYAVTAGVILMIAIAFAVYNKAKNGALLSNETRRNRAPLTIGWMDYVLLNKYFVDEWNNLIFVRFGRRISNWLWQTYDIGVIDTIVNGVAAFTSWTGSVIRRAQTGYVRNYAFSMVIGIIFILIACLSRIGTH